MAAGHNESLWVATTGDWHHPPMADDHRVDVAIVGGGITGLTAAYHLQQAGLSTVVLERGEIAHFMTGHTTAHLTQVFDTGLPQLVNAIGDEGAKMVWDAGRTAIATIERIAATEGIDCHFQRVPAYLVAATLDQRQHITDEVSLARRLGFPVQAVDSVPYPLPCHGAMMLSDQGQCHPRRYLLALASRILDRGGRIFGDTQVQDIEAGKPHRLHANGRTVTADHVVWATHQAIASDWIVLKTPASQTYVVAYRLPKGTFPQALAWDADDPYHYWRQEPGDDHDLLIVGGEDHRTGQEPDTPVRFARLEAYAGERLAGVPHTIAYRWSGQVLNPVDGVPFIGRLGEDNQYIGTGYAGNGMTMGTFAGTMIARLIQGEAVAEAEVFRPSRLELQTGLGPMIRENIAFPQHFLLDRFKVESAAAMQGLQPGEGTVVELDGEKVAVSRDDANRLQAVSAVCRHLGCLVGWNAAERSWDCPCHGSRYFRDGGVLCGPTKEGLPQVTMTERRDQAA
jgi:glycine/D-amino acid oxidase-like deaminating enzyme/nitrite reductase/ring-hydroxylating ferredoxin subunit